PSPDRRDWAPERRAEELRQWSKIIEAPDYAVHIWRDVMPDLGDRLLRQSLEERRRGLEIMAAHEAALVRERTTHEAALVRERTLRATAESERDAVLASTTWRITAPLRRAVDRLRRSTSR